MSEVRNLDNRLVGEISMDKRFFEIHLKGCSTRIKINEDGTLGVTHRKTPKSPPLKQ